MPSFGQLESAVMSLEAKVLELKAEHRNAFTSVPDTEEEKKVTESSMAQGKCKLLLLTSAEAIKKTFSRRARGLVVVESWAGNDEYKRVGIFVGRAKVFEELSAQIIQIV